MATQLYALSPYTTPSPEARNPKQFFALPGPKHLLSITEGLVFHFPICLAQSRSPLFARASLAFHNTRQAFGPFPCSEPCSIRTRFLQRFRQVFRNEVSLSFRAFFLHTINCLFSHIQRVRLRPGFHNSRPDSPRFTFAPATRWSQLQQMCGTVVKHAGKEVMQTL